MRFGRTLLLFCLAIVLSIGSRVGVQVRTGFDMGASERQRRRMPGRAIAVPGTPLRIALIFSSALLVYATVGYAQERARADCNREPAYIEGLLGTKHVPDYVIEDCYPSLPRARQLLTTTAWLSPLLFVPILLGAITYNRLVALRHRVDNAYGQVATSLRKRYDLVPALVESVSGYMAHEKSTLTAVVAARARAVKVVSSSDSPHRKGIAELEAAENSLDVALGRLLVVSESYPELKAAANMKEFSASLASLESEIAVRRSEYNDSVTAYNTFRDRVPIAFVAPILGFSTLSLFAIDEPEVEKPVKFSFR